MASIDCMLDTEPMAREINRISGHVVGTTAAVTAMQAAVIKAEKDAADNVCDNVNRGFYTLIRSQISQKTAKLQSEVDSHLMKLNQLKKQLLALRDRMERDYNMTSARYFKLFNALNRELKNRVQELDRPTFDFAQDETSKLSNRQTMLTGTVSVSQLESVAYSQRIMVSNLKLRASNVIDSMNRFLCQSEEQKRLSDKILLQGRAVEAHVAIPVIVSESLINESGNTSTNVIVDSTGLSNTVQMDIRNRVSGALGDLQWTDNADNSEVAGEFNRMVADSQVSPRVKKMMEQMFASASMQTLKKV